MLVLNQTQNIVIGRNQDLSQIPQILKYGRARCEIADRQFADHEGMHHNLLSAQQVRKNLIGVAQMVDPHGAVDQDHAAFDRRLRTGFKSG